MEIKPIAKIHTDFSEKFGIPRQSGLVNDLHATIVFEPQFRNPDAVRGMEEFSHLWLIWEFSETKRENWSATVAPPRLGGRERVGVFATRSPYRPNPLGLSSVKLDKVEFDEQLGPVLHVLGADILDGTPIYDIKPYLPYADCHADAVGGFGARVLQHRLEVHFPEDLLQQVEPQDRDVIIHLLEEDPRTAFIHDETRVWGISYKKYNIRFTVVADRLTVCEVGNSVK